ncbi:cellobiose 2-epimerase [Parapedobacter pyrenivorans]|uniref:Cellobiose 2-epimerase n=1 Tax=Parapedobacter pyrenivorans TaxID=1305674 RepID=A0A917HPB9_9SPHI|nr:AGE family epimerase/isomerase [Parapedobacter pyrenivorans]GGG84734.1 cellobiose 2-epimerase [Parapedobacter pyrenivorans]
MNVSSDKIKPYQLKGVEFETELHRILAYWGRVVFDNTNARFHPKVDVANRAYNEAPAGSVMYARILWAFSAGYLHAATPHYLKMANTAYRYIRQHFVDPEYGGVYWSLQPDGSAADSRKQIYAIAFTIYGLAEYYKINADPTVLAQAKQLYQCIEQYSLDRQHGGYIEAFHRDWTPTNQLRLSAKDDNEKKTLNTHLHILEAYTNLYTIWPNDTLKQRIAGILQLFEQHFITDHGHLRLFFDEQWQSKSSLQSFGHDIEASWLICEASQAIHGGQVTDTVRSLCLRLAHASLEWVDESGALPYELNPITNQLNAEKHWWVQAEAVVGFYRAGLLSGDNRYIASAARSWQYITDYLIDHQHGEWHWGRDETGQIIVYEDKAGFWKCPYHNSRCCLQLMQLMG